MRTAWLALVFACGGARPPSAPVVHPAETAPPKPESVLAVRASADDALRKGVPLDYERPFAAKTLDRSATAKLFDDACNLGDKHACIVESQLATGEGRFRAIEANCMAGDQLSCRALPLDETAPRFPHAPGAMSRRAECQKHGLAAPCDAAALHAECAAGFPVACDELQNADPEQPVTGAELTSWPRQSLRGCQGGIASECLNVYQYGTASDQLDVAQRACELRPGECVELGMIQEKQGDLTAARDSYERMCQYGSDSLFICVKLAAGYLDRTYQEPVPGRGQALIDWACPRLAKGDRARLPACARATAH